MFTPGKRAVTALCIAQEPAAKAVPLAWDSQQPRRMGRRIDIPVDDQPMHRSEQRYERNKKPGAIFKMLVDSSKRRQSSVVHVNVQGHFRF